MGGIGKARFGRRWHRLAGVSVAMLCAGFVIAPASAAGLRHAEAVESYARAMASLGQCRAFLSQAPVFVEVGAAEQAALVAASATEAEVMAYDALFREAYAREVDRARDESLRDGGGFCRQIIIHAMRAETVFRQTFLDALTE